jgi:hypothetical protein
MSDSTKWETIRASVTDLATAPDATEFERAHTEFRAMLVASDDRRYGVRVLVETTRLDRARFDLYAYTLDGIVRDIEVGLARAGVTAR